MFKSMIIKDGNTSHLKTCLAREHKEFTEKIPVFYSRQHALDNGWKITDDIKFCPPDQMIAWVCPECAQKYEWTNTT